MNHQKSPGVVGEKGKVVNISFLLLFRNLDDMKAEELIRKKNESKQKGEG